MMAPLPSRASLIGDYASSTLETRPVLQKSRRRPKIRNFVSAKRASDRATLERVEESSIAAPSPSLAISTDSPHMPRRRPLHSRVEKLPHSSTGPPKCMNMGNLMAEMKMSKMFNNRPQKGQSASQVPNAGNRLSMDSSIDADERPATSENLLMMKPTESPMVTPKESSLMMPMESPPMKPKESPMMKSKESPMMVPKDSSMMVPKDSSMMVPTESQPMKPKESPMMVPTESQPMKQKESPMMKSKGSPRRKPKKSPRMKHKESPPTMPKESPVAAVELRPQLPQSPATKLAETKVTSEEMTVSKAATLNMPMKTRPSPSLSPELPAASLAADAVSAADSQRQQKKDTSHSKPMDAAPNPSMFPASTPAVDVDDAIVPVAGDVDNSLEDHSRTIRESETALTSYVEPQATWSGMLYDWIAAVGSFILYPLTSFWWTQQHTDPVHEHNR